MSNADVASDPGPRLSKWQILALLGLGVSVTAVSVGVLWYLKRRRTSSPTQNPTGPSLQSAEKAENHCDSSQAEVGKVLPETKVRFDK